MQPDESLVALIDKAAEATGSKSKLARALGVTPQTVNGWQSGFRTCVPEDRARIAAFAHEDALQEFIRATLEKTAGTLRGEQLRQVLGKWLRQTGAATGGVLQGLASAIFLAWALMAPPPVQAEPIFHDVYYVKSSRERLFVNVCRNQLNLLPVQ